MKLSDMDALQLEALFDKCYRPGYELVAMLNLDGTVEDVKMGEAKPPTWEVDNERRSFRPLDELKGLCGMARAKRLFERNELHMPVGKFTHVRVVYVEVDR